MAGGRPPKEGGQQRRYPELEELAAWFRQAMADAGYETPNAVVRAEIAHKNVVYGIHGASRFLKLEVVRALAVALRRDPAEVEPLWTKAKEAVDRAAAARQATETPHLTSWSQLPLPELALRNLMEAQSRAVERLPYDKLGVEEPPLSAVYVRQRMRASTRSGDNSTRGDARTDGDGAQRMADPGRGGNPRLLESLLPVPDALARYEHLLITAEPGAGKSTLSSHLAWTLSRIWLRQDSSRNAPVSEPVVPVRIAARTLVDQGGSWSGVLCQAARRSLGRSLVADPDPGLFAGRVQGARWLVLVDGLDEIADRDARMGVIRTIAQHARAGSDYRFVVTSRPLPEAELAPLHGALIGAYGMEPFGAGELRDFAGKWFAAQYEGDDERARAVADRFLKEIEDTRLRELVRNPLLATIAAVNATVDRSRPLPSNRSSLYQRFCEHLLLRGTSAPMVRTELNRRYRDDPERRSFHLWLDQHKREVLGVLGRCRLEGEGALSQAALKWVRERAGCEGEPGSPGLPGLPTGWEAEVREFLQGTGLLVPEDDDYRFLHHSFAEFIAAQSYALEIPPDFPDAEVWIRRALSSEEKTLAMFVFCLWAEREECEADRLAETLLSETAGWGHRRSLLAGTLLAEGVPLGEENRALILDRLEALVLNSGSPEAEDAFKVLGALGGLPGVLQRLERMAAAEQLDPMGRLYAVEAYSQAGDREVAERLLGSVLGWIYGAIQQAAEVACSISEGAREAVRRRALTVAEEPGTTDVFLMARAALALERLDHPRETAELARRVLESPQSGATELKQATEAWLKAQPSEGATIAALALERPPFDQPGRAAVAQVLERLGEPEAAAGIAAEVLGSGTPDIVALESAARTWIKVRGAEGSWKVMTAFEQSSADLGHDLDAPATLLSSVAPFTEGTTIADWAREVLGEHRWGTFQGGSVVSAWLTAEGSSAADTIMNRIGRGQLLESYARAEAAEAMLDAGARQEAAELAERALRTPNLSQDRYKQSTRVLVKAVDERATELLERVWRENHHLHVDGDWLHGVLDALSEQDRQIPATGAAISHFARELVELGSVKSEDVVIALEALADSDGRNAVPYIVETAKSHPRLQWTHRCDIASGLAAMGERSPALDVWRFVLELSYPPIQLELRLLLDLEAAGVTAEAASWIRELIDDPATYPPRRLRLRQMLAWLSAGEAANSTPEKGRSADSAW